MNEQKYLIDECKRKWLIQTYLCNFNSLLRIAQMQYLFIIYNLYDYI